jgi:hypothetical protein
METSCDTEKIREIPMRLFSEELPEVWDLIDDMVGDGPFRNRHRFTQRGATCPIHGTKRNSKR